MSSIIEVKNMQKIYANRGIVTRALDNISFIVDKGDFVAVMGSSGCGKTTLLNCISNIEKITSGQFFFNGIDMTKVSEEQLFNIRREKIGFIFQNFNLLETLNVYENIHLALSILGVETRRANDEILKIASILRIEDILKKMPYEISGGQKQIVAAARAIIKEPDVILADEPTGSLDSRSTSILLETLNNFNKSSDLSIIMVTHDVFVASYCKRVLFMRDGRFFSELIRGNQSRKEFLERIIDVVTVIGGNISEFI